MPDADAGYYDPPLDRVDYLSFSLRSRLREVDLLERACHRPAAHGRPALHLEGPEATLAVGAEAAETHRSTGDAEELLQFVLADEVLVVLELDLEGPLDELRPADADSSTVLEAPAPLVHLPGALVVGHRLAVAVEKDDVLVLQPEVRRQRGRGRGAHLALRVELHLPTAFGQTSEEIVDRDNDVALFVLEDLRRRDLTVRGVLLDLWVHTGGETVEGHLEHRVEHDRRAADAKDPHRDDALL